MGRSTWLLGALALAGCEEALPPAQVEAALAAGRAVEVCDATITLAQGEAVVERAIAPEPLALAILAMVPFVVLGVLLLLRKVRPWLTLVAMAVLLLGAAGLSVFVGTERFTFEPEQRRVHRDEGWLLDLYRTERTISYFQGMSLWVAEEYEDETLYMRIWFQRSPGDSTRIVECRGTHSTTEGLRQTLPAVARAIEAHAGLR